MNEQDKMWIEKCKADKLRYTVMVDNDCIYVDDAEIGDCVYTFSEYGYYFAKELLQYIGCDADFV